MNGSESTQSTSPENVSNAIVILGVVIALVIALVIAGAINFLEVPIKTNEVAEKKFYTLQEYVNTDGSLVFLPVAGEAITREFDMGTYTWTIVELLGRVVSVPVFNNQAGEFWFDVKFESGEGNITATLVLGKEDSMISVVVADDGFIDPQGLVFNAMLISEAVELLSTGDPVYVTFSLQSEVPDGLINDAKCDDGCKRRIARTVELYPDTELLIDAIRSDNPLDKTLVVGPVSQIITYDND